MRLERSRFGRGAAVASVAVALAAGASACGSSNHGTTTGATTTAAVTTAATTTQAATRTVRIYVVHDGKLVAESREVPKTAAVGRAALQALLGDRAFDLAIDDGVATVTGVAGLTHAGAAEIVATLTQFPTVTAVALDGKRLTRLDIEDVTPSILVESPLPGDHVASPVQLSGTADTFEATFMVEVLGRDDATLSRKVVTATSGSGTRGTFDTEIGYDIAAAQPGTIYVYEASAEDGRPIHEERIPVTLEP